MHLSWGFVPLRHSKASGARFFLEIQSSSTVRPQGLITLSTSYVA